jgi:hypothetical protein
VEPQGLRQQFLGPHPPYLPLKGTPAVPVRRHPTGHGILGQVPIDEQTFLVNTINKLEKSKDWSSPASVPTCRCGVYLIFG